jgi:hypothetical protein
LTDASDALVQLKTTAFLKAEFEGLSADTLYNISVTAVDPAGNESVCACTTETTASESDDIAPRLTGNVSPDNIGPIFATVTWLAAEDDGTIANYAVTVTDGAAQNVSLDTTETTLLIDTLTQGTSYDVTVTAEDNAGQMSNSISGSFTTTVNPYTTGCDTFCITETSASSIEIVVQESNTVVFHYNINGGDQQNIIMAVEGGVSVHDLEDLSVGDQVNLSFTVEPLGGGAYNTDWETYVFTGSF